MKSIGHRTYLTQGQWDVTEIIAYDPDERFVYFTTSLGDPRKRHLYRLVAFITFGVAPESQYGHNA